MNPELQLLGKDKTEGSEVQEEYANCQEQEKEGNVKCALSTKFFFLHLGQACIVLTFCEKEHAAVVQELYWIFE